MMKIKTRTRALAITAIGLLTVSLLIAADIPGTFKQLGVSARDDLTNGDLLTYDSGRGNFVSQHPVIADDRAGGGSISGNLTVAGAGTISGLATVGSFTSSALVHVGSLTSTAAGSFGGLVTGGSFSTAGLAAVGSLTST